MQTVEITTSSPNSTNAVLAVRCINPKNTGLKTDKVYEVTESENFKDCFILDVGWNWMLSKDMFELVGKALVMCR